MLLRKGYAWLLKISKGLLKIIEYQKFCAFLLRMSMVYTYILIDSISEFYTYLLFDDVSEDVCLCTCILCTPL